MSDASKTHGEILFDALIVDEQYGQEPDRGGLGTFDKEGDVGTVLDGVYHLQRAAEVFLTSAGLLGKWRPMKEHVFPWDDERLVVAAHKKGDLTEIQTFVCTCGEHGWLYPDTPEGVGCLALDEIGWTPFAWYAIPQATEEQGT